MAENSSKNANTLSYDTKEFRQGEVVEAEVFLIKEDGTIILTLPNYKEATMHKDHFTHDQSLNLNEVLKKGDKIEVKIVKIEEKDENNQIYVSRLNLIPNQVYDELEKIKEEDKTILTKIKEVRENGLVLVYKGTELFIPDKLLDNKLLEQKETLKNKELEVNVLNVKKGQRRTSVICTRLLIIKKEKELLAKEREEARQKALDNINIGDVLDVEVVKILKNSAEVRINQYLNGQVRISQVSYNHIVDLEKELLVGSKHKAKVLDKQGRRIDLSFKALLKTPFENYIEQNPVGTIVSATIESKLDKGYIVMLSDLVQSFLSNFELTYNPRLISSFKFEKGDKVEVKIISVDQKDKKIYISLKQKEENPWEKLQLERTDNVQVEVVKVQDNGAGLDILYNGVNGFISKRDLKKDLQDYKKGDILDCFVLKANPSKFDFVVTERPFKKVNKE